MSCLESKDLKIDAEVKRAERESGFDFTVIWPGTKKAAYTSAGRRPTPGTRSPLWRGRERGGNVSNAVVIFQERADPGRMLDIEDCVK